jgi:hypothetical protein
MPTARYFLAHAKQDADAAIDIWAQELPAQLSQPGWPAQVTPGRDDYEARAKALGGWKPWCTDVPQATDYRGGHLFHGVIVPVGDPAQPTVGRATASLVQGFLDAGKHALAWCPSSCELFRIEAVEDNSDADSWKAWGFLRLAA